MDFARALSRSSSSSSSYNTSFNSDADNNKTTPTSSSSRNHLACHQGDDDNADNEQAPAVAAAPDLQVKEEDDEEEEEEDREQHQVSRSDLFLSATTNKHPPPGCYSTQPLLKLARSDSFHSFSLKHHGFNGDDDEGPLLLRPALHRNIINDNSPTSNYSNSNNSYSNNISSFSLAPTNTGNYGAAHGGINIFHGSSPPFSFVSHEEARSSPQTLLFPSRPGSAASGPHTSKASTPNFSGSAICDIFTIKQWNEFTQQVYIFKHIAAGVNPPATLLLPLINSMSSLSRVGAVLPQIGSTAGGFGFARGAIDPEPGRCRRTDGKKWRCGRDVVPDQKYCERHMNRGRHRSRAKTNGADSTLATSNLANSKCVVLSPADLIKTASQSALSRDSQLHFSLVTPCKSASGKLGLFENMNKPLQSGASNTFAAPTLPSSKASPMSLSQTQMTHDLFKGSAPATTHNGYDIKYAQRLDGETSIRSMRQPSLPFQGLNGRREVDNMNPLDSHVGEREWQRSRDPLPLYEDPERKRAHSGMDLSMNTRSLAKFNREEEILEEESRPSWVPISWDSAPVMGGPLMEVLQSNNSNAKDGHHPHHHHQHHHHHHALASPTGVLHRVAFGSYSDSSSSASSPRSSALKTDSSLIGLCETL